MNGRETVRRPGYAAETTSVGRRGRHTRERILACAAALFASDGYHDVSIEAIAKAAGGSRATVYQYFESKLEIFMELVDACRPAVLAHGQSLNRLGPDESGIRELHRWLSGWTSLYEQYAVVFAEFPGVGTVAMLFDANVGVAPKHYTELIAEELRRAGISGIDPADAAAAILRIAHMLNLQRFRTMFGLVGNSRIAVSLTIAMQQLIFPNTSARVLATVGDEPTVNDVSDDGGVEIGATVEDFGPDPAAVSPIRQDILSAASALFAERGYYAVSMDDIAASADVNRATLYRHFSTKALLLDELSSWAALECAHLSAELSMSAESAGLDELRSWLGRYVHYHRTYGGVITAWYDGAIRHQTSEASLVKSMNQLHQAVQAFLSRFPMPSNMDRAVGAAIFLAVLGRLSEYVFSAHPTERDYDAAGFMLLVLRRALLGVE